MPGPRKRSAATRDAYYGLGGTPPPSPDAPPVETGYPTTPGQILPPDPNNFWYSVDQLGNSSQVPVGTPGAFFSQLDYDEALKNWQDLTGQEPGGKGATGPSAAELAIERSKVQATNLASFLDATIAGISADIDARRLTSEQAIGEFNRRLDAFEAAGTEFRGIQPYTIPQGAEYIPGFGPEGPATRVGLQPVKASPTMYDPFGMAADIVATTPNIAAIGAPSTSALQQAIEMARRFI